jgi:predicted Holliday junction resolvase-like endonuclease|tara:strand:+ start:390 stop:686 length:297 start_codon:yes stop_codon:yes gene_type:complete
MTGLALLSLLFWISIAILNIILFFKVWGMTNNVKILTKIAQKFTNMEYLLEEEVLVRQDEYKKLCDDRERIENDLEKDEEERWKLVWEINKKIEDTRL